MGPRHLDRNGNERVIENRPAAGVEQMYEDARAQRRTWMRDPELARKPRLAALVRVEFTPGARSGQGRRSRWTASHRSAMRTLVGAALQRSTVRAIVVEAGCLVVEFATPSESIGFAQTLVTGSSAAGLSARAVVDVRSISVALEEGELLPPAPTREPGWNGVFVTDRARIALTGTAIRLRPARRQGVWAVADERMVARPARKQKAVAGGPGRNLSRREREIAALLGHGLSYRDIAARLRISPTTVERHVSNVYLKLDVRSRVDVAIMVASGLLKTSMDAPARVA
jgi:DNA-binding CsgD family transcriptional regulator